MAIEVHRSRRTFYAQYTTLLNIPTNRFDKLLADSSWPFVVSAKYLEFPELVTTALEHCVQSDSAAPKEPGVSAGDLDDLLKQQAAGKLGAEDVLAELQRLRKRNTQTQDTRSPERLKDSLVSRTGVPTSHWEQAAHEILESMLPQEIGRPHALSEDQGRLAIMQQAQSMGLQDVLILDDFPMILAAYGYTRTEDGPRSPGRNDVLTRLNPFPADRDHAGRTPVFVDQINADALVLRLNPLRVLDWLTRNGVAPKLPSGSDRTMSVRGYFVQLFSAAKLRETLPASEAAQRMVFGLLHTFAHLGVRHAALLSGLERTSLSEYLLPSTLGCVIYCNHRFGATIGALTSLFEQSLDEWLSAIKTSHRCIYDPVCNDSGANCHACTHLAETSCRYFNLNLSRSFLFSGPDEVLGRIRYGYFQGQRGIP